MSEARILGVGLRWPLLVASLALAAMLAIPAAGAQVAAAKAPAGFYGVTPIAAPTDADLARMGQARVGTLRVMFNWGEIQPAQGGAYDFGNTDRIVAQAGLHRIQLLPFLYGTPQWARNCAKVPKAFCDRVDPLRSAAGRQSWPEFAAALAGRYGPGGSFWTSGSFEQILGTGSVPALPIREWQAWNEANSGTFFQPSPTAGAYHRLLASTTGAIRSVDPTARIVLSGLFATPPSGQSMERFLNGLYRIGGAKSLFDAVAIHPYSPDLGGMVAQIEIARRAMRRGKDGGTGLMLTEFGWGSRKRGKRASSLYQGAKGQRRMLKRSFSLLTRKRRRYKIDAILWFSWRDAPVGSAGQCLLCESFGLLEVGGKAKPAMGAYARFTGGS